MLQQMNKAMVNSLHSLAPMLHQEGLSMAIHVAS